MPLCGTLLGTVKIILQRVCGKVKYSGGVTNKCRLRIAPSLNCKLVLSLYLLLTVLNY